MPTGANERKNNEIDDAGVMLLSISFSGLTFLLLEDLLYLRPFLRDFNSLVRKNINGIPSMSIEL